MKDASAKRQAPFGDDLRPPPILAPGSGDYEYVGGADSPTDSIPSFLGAIETNGSLASQPSGDFEATGQPDSENDELEPDRAAAAESMVPSDRRAGAAPSSASEPRALGNNAAVATEATTTTTIYQGYDNNDNSNGEQLISVNSSSSTIDNGGTTSTTLEFLINSLFSHIDKQWKSAEVILIIVISAILNLVTIIGNIMVLISFKMDKS